MIALHFAPLQGYTDDVYRRLHHQLVGGVDFYYTPFVRLEHGAPRSKDLRDIAPEHNENVPVVPQIIAANLAEFRTLTQLIVEKGYQRIDLNMGCPFPLQAKHGRGCGLLAKTDDITAMFAEMKQHPDVQFSIKLRLGWDDSTVAQRLLPLINEAPIMQVTLHPRIGTQGYKGTTDMDAFSAFAAECTKPLVYNGDLTSPEEVLQLHQRFPQLAGIMIGRGLLARPSLGAELRDQREWVRMSALLCSIDCTMLFMLTMRESYQVKRNCTKSSVLFGIISNPKLDANLSKLYKKQAIFVITFVL